MLDVPEQILLPYQITWQEDESPIRIGEKSRRVGFSWNIAAEASLEASEIDGCDAWYVGYNKEMAQEFIRDVAFWSRNFNLICTDIEEEELFEDGRDDKAILTYTVRFASGFRITALSSRPTNLRNKKGHIIIDEAAFHDDLKGLLKAALAVRLWGGKGRVDIISTHNGVENFFNELLEEVKSGKRPYSLHRVTIDDAIHEGLVKRIFLVNNKEWEKGDNKKWREEIFAEYGDDAAEELLCVPSRSGGTYITRNLIERQMIDGPVYRLSLPDTFVTKKEKEREAYVAEWCETLLPALRALPEDMMHFFGEDFGRVSDRTVIAPGFLTQDLKRRFPFAVELLNVPFEQQKQVLFYVVSRLPRFFAGALDATGNGAYLAEVAMQKFGADRISCIHLTDQWYAVNLPPFKSAFEDELVEVVRDADHLNDLAAFKVINGIPKLPKVKNKSKKEGPPRHGDAAIAYLIGHFASKMPIQEYDYKAAPINRTLKAGFRKRKQGVL